MLRHENTDYQVNTPVIVNVYGQKGVAKYEIIVQAFNFVGFVFLKTHFRELKLHFIYIL